MSLDYNYIFKEQTTSLRFKEWVDFWHLGEIQNSGEEIETCIKELHEDIYNTKELKRLATSDKDKLEDLFRYLHQNTEEVTSTKLFEYILKFEKSWSAFKSKVIVDDDDYFSELLKRLEAKDKIQENPHDKMASCALDEKVDE